ncbi:U3 small nucleolar RNA-associated protein 11 [Viridothelium virens]|uniref:U3 small nucleolar RNA-associated protein 11 n=1 Tax=Viridothelium virens TaxID=1048519 RepID=A0A6A6H851_VIRVR|nr:U3 small nucleolar RNA-associated protein 11 [Viridothelium virens]
MSSMWRNSAGQRRNHKERAQPIEREKHGLLEKHKDYSLRAADFASKKRRLRALRQKAAMRNPDEFSFAMLSSRTDGRGVRIADRGNRPLSQDVVKLLKTQDIGYVRTMLQKTRKERERAEQEVQILEGGEGDKELRVLRNLGGPGGKGKGTHTVFVGSKDQQLDFRAEEWFGTDKKGLKRSWNRGKREEVAVSQEDGEDGERGDQREQVEDGEEAFDRTGRRRIQRSKESRRKYLEALKEREQDLIIAEQELDLQRAKMNNTATTGVNKNGDKFKIRERKK